MDVRAATRVPTNCVIISFPFRCKHTFFFLHCSSCGPHKQCNHFVSFSLHSSVVHLLLCQSACCLASLLAVLPHCTCSLLPVLPSPVRFVWPGGVGGGRACSSPGSHKLRYHFVSISLQAHFFPLHCSLADPLRSATISCHFRCIPLLSSLME